MITCADQPGNPACIDFSKFICKRQYNSVIEDITDGTTNFADAKTNLQQLIDDGDCAEYYVPSIPIQHRCMPGTADGNQTEFEEQLEGMLRFLIAQINSDSYTTEYSQTT